MSQFFADLTTNRLEVQKVDVKEMISCPAIEIGGAVFNGDVSGGVTLPYLETNYLKKSDAGSLADITSTQSEVVVTKTLNAPSVSTSTVNATNVNTNMQNVTGISAVNVNFVNDKFADKASVYTKAASDAISNTKLDLSSFNTFQQTNAQNIALKADIGASYLKSQTDTLLTGKVDNSTFGNYQSSVTNSLSTKQNIGDAYSKAQVDNIVSGKLDKSYGVTNDTAVANKVSQFAFDNFVLSTNNALAAKGDIGNVYSKTESNELLALKVSNDQFQTYTSANANALNTKVSQTAFDSFQSSNTNALNSKVSSTDFGQYQTQNTAVLQTKYNVSDFNSFNASNNVALNNRLLISDFNLHKSANDIALGLRLEKSVYNAEKSALDTLVASKANSSDVYNKTQVDAKDTFIQNSIDAYKTSNNSAVASKLETSTFNSYKTSNDASVADKISNATFTAYDTQVTSNFNSLQSQVNQRVKITDFNSFVTNNNQRIDTKQDIIPYSFNQNLTTTDSPTFSQVIVSSAPSSATSLANKQYVDSVGTSSVLAGTGLTKGSDNVLSVNPIQSQITQVGTLSSLAVSGNSTFSSPITLPSGDTIRFTRAGGQTGQMLIGADASSNELFNIKHLGNAGNIQLTTATNGLVSFNTPTVSILSTNDSTSTTTCSLKVAGGVGIAKTLFVGGELFISNGGGSRLKLQSNGGSYFLGSVDQDMSGIVHLYSATHNSRIWGYYPDNTFRIGFYNGSTVLMATGTADTASATSGALQVLGGIGIGKSAYISNNLTVIGTSTLFNLNVTGSTVLGTANVSTLNQDIFTRTSASNTNTASQSHARSAVIQSNNTVNSTYDMFELRAKDGSTVLRSSFGNGYTSIASGFYSAGGQFDMGSTAAGSTIASGVVATLAASGTGNSAEMDFVVNGGSTNTSMWKFYRSGNPANPLATISGVDGAITTGNYSTGVINASTTQAGVNMGRSADFVNWSRTGKIAEIFYQLILISQSGTQTGSVTFQLPVAAAVTCTMDSNYYLYRNGAQVSNVRLNLTANSTNCTLTVNNGFGTYVAFGLQNTENLTLLFQYPTV